MLIYHKIFLDAHSELGLEKIPKGWCVHHINGNHYDNDSENLQLMTLSDHSKWHIAGKKPNLGNHHTDMSKLKMSKAKTGQIGPRLGVKLSCETRQKIRELKLGNTYNRGRKHSDETRQKFSNARKGKPSPNKGNKYSDEIKRKISELRKGKQVKTTQEVIDDVVLNGVNRHDFRAKHNLSDKVFYAIRKAQRLNSNKLTLCDYLQSGCQL